MNSATVLHGDALEMLRTLPSESVFTCVTSPPYFNLRDYQVDGQIGLEASPKEYICRLVEVFSEVRRVLRKDGTLWLNIGSSYAGNREGGLTPIGETGQRKGRGNDGLQRSVGVCEGFKPKDMIPIPWMLAMALQADGWYLRSDIIWHKPNPMPESVTDRPTKAHEYLFLLSKSANYYYDAEAIMEKAISGSDLGLLRGRSFADAKNVSWHAKSIQDRQKQCVDSRVANTSNMRNKRTVWSVSTEGYADAHFATFPPKLIKPCILAGCPPDGLVLDPFAGSGTTLAVSILLGRNAVGIELNADYLPLIEKRIEQAKDKTSWGLFEEEAQESVPQSLSLFGEEEEE